MGQGKYCQMCGQPRGTEVITEVHGVVVTAECLMNKVYTDPPASPAEVQALARYCPGCGRSQPSPLPSRCAGCGRPLTPAAEAEALAATGKPASLKRRGLAFLLDLFLIALLCWPAVLGLRQIESHLRLPEESYPLPLISLVAVAFIFVTFFYHAFFTAAFATTPAKFLFGLRIVLKNGTRRIGLSRSLLRSAFYLLALYLLIIGFPLLLIYEPKEKWLSIIENHALFYNSLTDTVVIQR